jgi:FkbM family methyltransferase
MKFDPIALAKWHQDRGDFTHNINYELTDDSVVVDLGGFRGLWADVLLQKAAPAKPNIILVEPVPEFYNYLVEKFKDQHNIKILGHAVSTDNQKGEKNIYVSSDGSSTNYVCGPSVKISTIPVEEIIKEYEQVDLMQINIEGDEYALMEHMLDTNVIKKIKNIQIQYHLGIENDRFRRYKIQHRLREAGFISKFDYPFVWEGWQQQS